MKLVYCLNAGILKLLLIQLKSSIITWDKYFQRQNALFALVRYIQSVDTVSIFGTVEILLLSQPVNHCCGNYSASSTRKENT